MAAKFGVGKLRRHLFVCIGPDCVNPDEGEKTWAYLESRMKALNIAGKYPSLSADEKAAAGKTAMVFSRINTMLSIPMLFCMVGAMHI